MIRGLGASESVRGGEGRFGLALLPCYRGEGDSELARALPDPVPELAGKLWIVTNADLRGRPEFVHFFDVVSEGLAREQG